MKKKFLAPLIIVGLLLSFAAGTLAASNWMNFTGDEAIEESETQVVEIMDILRQVNEDKLTAEEALAELEALNPPGLVKKIKELEREIEGLREMNKHQVEYIAHLEAELERANQKTESINQVTTNAVEEAREIAD